MELGENALSGLQNACAEVFESSLHTFSAQSWQWDVVPSFGSMVVSGNEHYWIYGVVYSLKTESLDPMSGIHVYKKTEQEMLKEYPHLFDFLRTTFQVLIIGYEKHGQFFYKRPTMPIKLYSFVRCAHEQKIRQFFLSDNCLSLLMNPKEPLDNYEDMICSLIKIQKELGMLSEERLCKIVSQYGLITRSSYTDLKVFLEKTITL